MYVGRKAELNSMAKSKRMINCDFVNASSFKLKISNRAKLLYFFMMSNADDKGFVDNTDELIELLNINDAKFNATSNEVLLPDNYATSLDELITKSLVYCFNDKHENSIHLIKHWYYHNVIPKERVRPSSYEKYLKRLLINSDGEYVFSHNAIQVQDKCNADDTQLSSQIKLNEMKLNNIKTIERKNKTTSLPLVDDTVNELRNDTVNDTKKDTPKKAVQNRISLFDEFWNNYPRKIGKQKCANWFRIHKVDKPLLDKMLNAINEQKQSEQWQRDNGQYIPHPYTWLNQGRWEDETEIDLTAKPTKEQIEAQERKEAKMAEINNKEHIALLKARLAEATPNSKYAYSLELEIQVAQGKITEEEAERKLTEYNPVDMDIPLSAIDFSAMKGIKKL